MEAGPMSSTTISFEKISKTNYQRLLVQRDDVCCIFAQEEVKSSPPADTDTGFTKDMIETEIHNYLMCSDGAMGMIHL